MAICKPTVSGVAMGERGCRCIFCEGIALEILSANQICSLHNSVVIRPLLVRINFLGLLKDHVPDGQCSMREG